MWTQPSAPTSRTLVLLGEAPGSEEEKSGQPFVGASGRLLTQILEAAGLSRASWHVTNVFQQRPPNNDLKAWTANKTELKKMCLQPVGSPITKRYLLPAYWPQVERTKALLQSLKPDLVVALGGKALWLLSDDDRIGTFRGTFFPVSWLPGTQAIATFHPAAVLREYKMLPIAQMDLQKAASWIAGTLPAPLRRTLIINPTWDEIAHAYAWFRSHPRESVGVDIETAPSVAQITTISFSTPTFGICIPFWNKDAPAGRENFWPQPSDEVRAWRWVEKFCRLPNPKVLQNGLYDMQYMMDAPIDLRLSGRIDDTAIMQHSYQPELRKDLGSLASFYLNEPSWKQMRTSAKDAKADE